LIFFCGPDEDFWGMLKRKKIIKKMTATLFASSQKHGKLQIKVSECVSPSKRNETTPTFANSIFASN
jgi:hypothetical protein